MFRVNFPGLPYSPKGFLCNYIWKFRHLKVKYGWQWLVRACVFTANLIVHSLHSNTVSIHYLCCQVLMVDCMR